MVSGLSHIALKSLSIGLTGHPVFCLQRAMSLRISVRLRSSDVHMPARLESETRCYVFEDSLPMKRHCDEMTPDP
jgi:hypothetical protein